MTLFGDASPIECERRADEGRGDGHGRILGHIRDGECLVVRGFCGPDSEMEDAVVRSSCPVSVPVSVIVLLAPGASVPRRKLESFNGSEEEAAEKPKGKTAERTTLLIGIVALLRAVSVSVNGVPETISAGVSTDTESGVEETASAKDDFFTKMALESAVLKEKETGKRAPLPSRRI